jgi:AcrR family transcriptional regulator
MTESSVKEKIMHFAKQEFLNCGYQDASLRNIATAAGMTTGAIYTYFKDKGALFAAIVDPVCIQIEGVFSELSKSYYTTDSIVSELTFQKTLVDLNLIYNFIYKNFDVFRILVVGADGSSRSNFIHTIVDQEVRHTIAYLERIQTNKDIDPQKYRTIIHIISESYIDALLEPVRHNMNHNDALKNLDFLVTFFTGGWQSVFKELFDKIL